MHLWKLLLLAACLALSQMAAAPPSTQQLFARAIKNDSTSTNYILIQVINDKTGETKLVCTEAPFLLGALHIEHNLKYDPASVQKALAMALSQSDLTFHFSKPEALKNLAQYHTAEQVDAMRAALKPYTNRQLPQQFKADGKGLDTLYMDKDKGTNQGAIAQVLLERGLLPVRQCYSGALTVTE